MLKVGDVVYIVRYALTRGIIKLTLNENHLRSMKPNEFYALGWHFAPEARTNRYYRSEQEAIQAAEQMRQKKLNLLHVQARKLVKKDIKVIDAERF